MNRKVKMIFVIGQPRCATTTLVKILGQHPDIFVPKLKEPHFFIPDKENKFLYNGKGKKIYFDKLGFISDLNDYNKNYDFFSNPHKVYVDGSTLYCAHQKSIELILNTEWIDPFFILNTRNAAKRAISHYLFSISRGEEFRSFEQCLIDEINNKSPSWLLNGFLNGSDTQKVVNYFIDRGVADKLKIIEIDKGELNLQNLNLIIENLDLTHYKFNTNIVVNENIIPQGAFMKKIRLLAISIRRLNPFLFDNRALRFFYNVLRKIMKISAGKSVKEDAEVKMEEIFWQYWKLYLKK